MIIEQSKLNAVADAVHAAVTYNTSNVRMALMSFLFIGLINFEIERFLSYECNCNVDESNPVIPQLMNLGWPREFIQQNQTGGQLINCIIIRANWKFNQEVDNYLSNAIENSVGLSYRLDEMGFIIKPYSDNMLVALTFASDDCVNAYESEIVAFKKVVTELLDYFIDNNRSCEMISEIKNLSYDLISARSSLNNQNLAVNSLSRQITQLEVHQADLVKEVTSLLNEKIVSPVAVMEVSQVEN